MKHAKTQSGEIGELMMSGICMLALAVLTMGFLENMRIVEQKMEVMQLARKYILRMEVTGYLNGESNQSLCAELEQLGITDITLAGTTMSGVAYGEEIVLNIEGKLEGKYEFCEKRVTTAKN